MTMQSPAHVAFSPRRVGAMVLRHWYLLSSSWPRVLDLIYWPAVQMLMWGFLQQYVSQNAGFFMQAAGTFIGAVMLWDILFRGQLVSGGNVRPKSRQPDDEPAAPGGVRRGADDPERDPAVDRHGAGVAPGDRVLRLQSVGAWPRARGVLFESAADKLGDRDSGRRYPAPSRPRRRDHGVELPPTYVFEGMRALIVQHVFRAELMIQSLALNAVWFAGGVIGFLLFLKSARREGTLLQGGD